MINGLAPNVKEYLTFLLPVRFGRDSMTLLNWLRHPNGSGEVKIRPKEGFMAPIDVRGYHLCGIDKVYIYLKSNKSRFS